MTATTALESWGRYPRAKQAAFPVYWSSDKPPLQSLAGTVLPYGRGRSYGRADVFTEDGRLVASYVQENMIRDFPAGGQPMEMLQSVISYLSGTRQHLISHSATCNCR